MMSRGREPFCYYDVEDDDFQDDLADEDLVGRDEFGFEEFRCCFPERCCMPGPHAEAECVSVEMTENPFAEASFEEGDPA